MALSRVSLPGRRRTAIALGAGVLAGSLALAGCSSSSPKGGGTIPPVSTAGAGGGSTASPAASGGTSTSASDAASAGAVTAESLSDPDLGYTVVSIPDGLDATQTKILQDYINYDKATWRLWFTNEGGDEMSAVASGQLLELIMENDANRNGELFRPPIRIAVSEVTVDSSGSANVSACIDKTKMTRVDAQGKDITKKKDQIRRPVSTKMVNSSNGRWLADEEKGGEADSCSV